MEMFGLDPTLFWFILGVVFFVLEAVTPGFFLMFFGLGAWTVALLDFVIPFPVAFQWIIFMAVSVITLIMLRSRMKSLFHGRLAKTDNMDDPVVSEQYIGREVAVLKDVGPGQRGLVELNGTNWQARTDENHAFSVGDRAVVLGLDGLTLVLGKPVSKD